jgi:glutamine synthetase
MSQKKSASFVSAHDLWSAEQHDCVASIRAAVKERGLTTFRLSFPDQHGLLRGKTLVADEALEALERGCTITTTLLAKDTSHRTVFPVFTAGGGFGRKQMQGGADALMIPDPLTFRVLPWSPTTGWLLCDLYFSDGSAVPFATRHLYRRALQQLDSKGYRFIAGLEVEFHLFKLEDARLLPHEAGQPARPPKVSLLSHGYQYLTEQRYDQVEPMLELLREAIVALQLPLRTMEVEFGPSQCEFTFAPLQGLAAADAMVIFKSAVKQVSRRHGYHATFMCRPRIPKVISSGWHLHQSLAANTTGGENVFIPQEPAEPLSPIGRAYLGGLLAHAQAATAFTTPTINGYKRYRAYSLAPDRAIWARDNRAAMIRVLGGMNDPATRLENRVGEPAANPYLYMASQVLSGLDGIERSLDPGPGADSPYETAAPSLPRTLREAVSALSADSFFRRHLSDEFIDYYVHIKTAELDRFDAEVTAWEQREYFDTF